MKDDEVSRLIKNEEDGTVEIREQLSKGDEKELERKDVSRKEADDLTSSLPVDEDRFAKVMRIMDETIERERQEEEMKKKMMKSSGIVECQIGTLKFRVQPPSPKIKVKRVKNLPPLSELAASEQEDPRPSSSITKKTIDNSTFSGEIVEHTTPELPTSTPVEKDGDKTRRPVRVSKFKQRMMQSRSKS